MPILSSFAFFGRKRHALALAVCCLCGIVPCISGAEVVIRPETANTISFPAVEAQHVRFVIMAVASPGEPCIDELEVYGPDSDANLALAASGAAASASSCLEGYTIHRVEHLNDGQYGNSFSWIAATGGEEWAQITLPAPARIDRIVFSRDRQGQFQDRLPIVFEVRVSTDGEHWETVRSVRARVPGASGLDGLPAPAHPPRPLPATALDADYARQLRYAFLAEEHAWLKTYGRADISPALVPYNGRVKQYPRHVGDDVLPLPVLACAPTLDGALTDPCWEMASRGVTRVAHPYDFDFGPLVTYAVRAGRFGDRLYFAVETDRLLSSHIASLSTIDGPDAGLVVLEKNRLHFNSYVERKRVGEERLLGTANEALSVFEFCVPVRFLDGVEENGVQVGLGIGGKHTHNGGRPVRFLPSALSLREVEGADGPGAFTVQFAAADSSVTVSANASGMDQGVTLAVGERKTVILPAQDGPLGPEFNLTVKESDDRVYALHLFRYIPIERPLRQLAEMTDRLAARGLDVSAERAAVETYRAARRAWPRAEARAHFLEVCLIKRGLFLRDPDLAPLDRILFVKRHPYLPSHNYSDYFDAPFRPGGGVCRLDIPSNSGGLEPSAATVATLFEARDGIPRDPAADYDLNRIYFGFRPSKDGYYHLMSMAADGSDLRQITDGPFYDFYPCPLPDGGVAFITTRCTARVFCWRPQSSVLFRMDPDGGNMRPLSLASLTEWAPSMMRDGRILWTRWEYVDKGADFGHTLWSIRPDGTHPEHVYGNTIIQPNGYVNGREMPQTDELCCTLISHFGDLNGPLALIDRTKSGFDPSAIHCITPEVPWPGAPPAEECFRDPYPVARDHVLCSHAPRDHFALYVVDRFGNRELLYVDPAISSMCPTLFRPLPKPPVTIGVMEADAATGEFFLFDIHEGLAPEVPRGTVKYLRVVEEVRHNLEQEPDGEYRKDHEAFFNFYASPVDLVSGPYGWPTYVAKTSLGLAPVAADGSVHFRVPAGKVLYFQALDARFNEVQRMRSVVQLQPGEKRSCIGCHEHRQMAPINRGSGMAAAPRPLEPPSWGAVPFSYAEVVQPVLDRHCAACHNPEKDKELDFTGTLDESGIPASYRTLITRGLVHYVDCGWNSGGCEKLSPLTFGSVKSPLWALLDAGHYEVRLDDDEILRIKTWTDLNCPLWPDYQDRTLRARGPGALAQVKE